MQQTHHTHKKICASPCLFLLSFAPSNLSSLPPPLSSFPALLFQPWIWPVFRYSWPLSVLYQYPHFLFGRNWIDTILDWLYLFFRSKRGPCKILYIERQEFITSCPVRSARCILSGFTNRLQTIQRFYTVFYGSSPADDCIFRKQKSAGSRSDWNTCKGYVYGIGLSTISESSI